ncbi:nucleotidyltransferase-like protein [Aneurinibacillus soli]|uniref:Uncharacterized protein n=1 Tax=Aneurinibacillus soli TaxID=1500254 RepID=A0A0U4WN16_9BACL|nr:nucleotidyltransferase-like protein [Aneurinibacillus soli]PYE56981.1 nucleotidyltransferase-like protein [Aneurinibacillus soli]BAU29625.1 hypothetical protein CB4_03855 [Aneurinibacillus soli]
MKQWLLQNVPEGINRNLIESIIQVTPFQQGSAFTDGIELLYIVIVNTCDKKIEVKNLVVDEQNVQVRWVSASYFSHVVEHRFQRRFVQWALQGELMYDANGFIENIRQLFCTHPSSFHKRKVCIEFSYFLRQYLEAKEYTAQGLLLDAYSNMFRALHHWARLSIMQEGYIPETVVWKQVQEIDCSIYKLYEELITTSEPLEKRLELLLLASDFSMVSKIKECSEFLFEIMKSRTEPWSVAELFHHPAFEGTGIDLILLLEKLVGRSLLQQVLDPTEFGVEKKYIVI